MLWYFDRASHILANVASSVIWLLITTILWVCLLLVPSSCTENKILTANIGCGSESYPHNARGRRLRRNAYSIEVSTVLDGRSFGMGRVGGVRVHPPFDVDLDLHKHIGRTNCKRRRRESTDGVENNILVRPVNSYYASLLVPCLERQI